MHAKNIPTVRRNNRLTISSSRCADLMSSTGLSAGRERCSRMCSACSRTLSRSIRSLLALNEQKLLGKIVRDGCILGKIFCFQRFPKRALKQGHLCPLMPTLKPYNYFPVTVHQDENQGHPAFWLAMLTTSCSFLQYIAKN